MEGKNLRNSKIEGGLRTRDEFHKKSEQGKPLISIITVVRNGEKYLEQTIQSVLNQTYKNIEYIIIDGASTDGTLDIVRKYEDQIAYWVSEPDNGICHAWNKALNHAKGKWLYFLGADDYFWSTDTIKQIVPYLCEAYPSVRVVYGRVAIVTEKGEILQMSGVPWVNAKRRILEVMSIPHQGVFHHQSLFEYHGRFNETFRVAGDFELLLRELKTRDAFFISEMTVAAMRVGGVSSDPYQSLRLLQEMHSARRSQGFVSPGWYWTLSILKVWSRMVLWWIVGEGSARKILDLGRRILREPSYWTRT